MTKILGLDLGTNSIGWAIVDKDAQKIIDSGVRIFTEGVNKDTLGKGDNEVTKNAERRQHRQARRGNFRKRLRKIKLLQLLIDLQMCPLTKDELNQWKNWNPKKKTSGKVFPDSAEFVNWLKMNPYELRKQAISNDITRMELGRIFYHLIQRRGFLSSRKGDEDGAIYKGNDKMEGINETRKLLDDGTLGNRLAQIYPQENKSYTPVKIDGKAQRIRGRYTLREMYIAEFEEIWSRQASHLGLDNVMVPSQKTIYLETSENAPKSQKKLVNLRQKYGAENVKVENKRVTIKSEMPLKTFLAGNIKQTENGLQFKSNESLLFWQRPLRSQKGMLGKCTFEGKKFFDKENKKWIEVGPTPCPVSHPDFELYRAYQFINDIRFGRAKTKLNDDQRAKVLDLMNKAENAFEFGKIPKELKLTYENFNFDDKYKIQGNPTHKKLMKYFSDDLWQAKYEEIWHQFYFFEDAELLKQKLIDKYALSEEDAEKASKIKLTDGYGSISLKAVRNILPFLIMGFRYSTAVVLGGVKNAFGKRWECFEPFHDEIIKNVVQLVEGEKYKEYELIAKLKAWLCRPENQFGIEENDKAFRKLYHHSQQIEKKDTKKRLSEIENLRNPIVQKSLNEMRRLINDLLLKYEQHPAFGPDFAFNKIHVEMGRDLKNSKKKRQEMVFQIQENERKNEDARIRLAEYGLKPGRENITKYRLFKEIEEKAGKAICPYTGKTVTVSQLLGSQNLYQIEHIVPFSVSLDDGFANKTICESNFNREKGELTPYEYYQKNNDPSIWGADSWDQIEQRAFAVLPFPKARRFVARKRLNQSDFVARQLNDTRYISKKATEILSEICDDVRVMPGQLTSELRRLWGLNNVIQPVFPLDLNGYEVDADRSIPHYLVLDSFGEPKQIIPVQEKRPETNDDQILIPGIITKKELFIADKNYRHLEFKVKTETLPPGRYWAKVSIEKPAVFTRIFTPRPETDKHSIVYRGRVEKGIFTNESLGRKIKSEKEDGFYWIKLQVKNAEFIEPEKDKQPSKNRNQVLLFGIVKDGVFSSYIYQCETDLPSGKYWVKLDIDFEQLAFSKAIVNPRQVHDNELILTGVADDSGTFVADCDPAYQVQTQEEAAKYHTIVYVKDIHGFYPVYRQEPELEKDESLMMGNVWVNKHPGEIMFDPKKNRDDHRHHAVDAIAIAFTELGFLQKLSHYYGEIKDRERGLGERPSFDPPWEGFDKDVKNAVDQILVSYARNRKVLSKISKIINKNGRKFKSVGYAARGQLHREFYFGKHPRPILNKPGKVGGEMLFETDAKGNIVYYFHIRKPVTSIKNHKHVMKIVDPGIQQAIYDRLKQLIPDFEKGKAFTIPDHFFFDKDTKQPTLFLKNKHGAPVPIKKVRMREYIGNAVQLKDNVNQWVNPYNNHHVVIYEDIHGELREEVVSFWDVIERQHQGEAIYKLPEDGQKIVATLQENDMYLLNLSPEQQSQLGRGLLSGAELSSHLYRVQKISSMYYTFRHHLASTIQNEAEEFRIQSMAKWKAVNPCKVEIDRAGRWKIK